MNEIKPKRKNAVIAPPDDSMRTCKWCGQLKITDREFYYATQGKRYSSHCKACHRDYQRLYYKYEKKKAA